jgi:glucokinase
MKLAIDIGGTNIRYATGSRNEHTRQLAEANPGSLSYEATRSLIIQLARTHRADSIHIAVPGPIKPPGIVSPSDAPTPNLPWSDAPLQEDLARSLEQPVYIQRDVFCAAQGILHNTTSSDFTLLYPGTGFGYATAMNNEVIASPTNYAGELAEQRCSSSQTYDEALNLSALTTFDDKNQTPETILRQGVTDPIRTYGEELATQTAPLISVTAPPTVYVGGHLAEHWGVIGAEIQNAVHDELIYEPTISQTDETPLLGAFTLGSGNIHF